MQNNPTSETLAIKLHNVSKYYKLYNNPKDRLKEALNFSGKVYHKKYYATQHLNLEIKKGEILGIVGKNGSGKSTLLKLITGVLTPNEGSVKVNGKISALLELGSGFNPQFTGIENIFFYGTILGFTKEYMKEKLDDIVSFADIGDFINQPLKSYSSGMKSRLGFAVAIHVEPEILILDEVLAVGDVLFKRKCYAKMEEFFKGGKTIIYVSHNANSVNELCTRAIFLDAGEILLDSDAKEVTAYYQKYLFANELEQNVLKDRMLNRKKNNNNNNFKPLIQPKTEVLKNNSDAFFVKEFQSKTMVRTGDLNVNIHTFQIQTLEGEIVNNLPYNREFIFSYYVKFNDSKLSLNDINFGMQIKNVQGVNISGTNTKNLREKLPIINTMHEYKISYHFKTNLSPQEYFINATIFLKNDNYERFYAKVLDSIVFKVLENDEFTFSGNTYLNQTFKIKELNNV